MSRRLPPLNWLRAFEAAARHEGFLPAARELKVSAGAVSQQVRHLETWLQANLFARRPRGVVLTAEGRALGARLGPLLDGIAAATAAVERRPVATRLRIVALPAFAERWLTPRLARFHAAAPDCTLELLTADSMAEATALGFDVALHHEIPQPGTMQVTPLFRDELHPVCSAGLAAGLPLLSNETLSRCRLLYDTAWVGDWTRWATVAGLSAPDLSRAQAFSLYSMAIEAAVAGQGLLLGHAALVGRELAAGQLVAPFDPRAAAPQAYAAFTPGPPAAGSPAARFLAWLRSEIPGPDSEARRR